MHPNKLSCFEELIFVGMLWMKKEYWCKLCVFAMGIYKQSLALWLGIARVASDKKFRFQSENSTCANV
jgi:hypothetical protein